jgi:FMN phosphatase YigB (HAD superfamily)
MHKLTKKQIPVHIFTNAPKEWCMNFIDPHENLHWVWDHIPQSLEYLKPQMPVYDALSTQFKQKTVYFIDDSIGNLTNSRTWENILFIDKVPHSSIPHIYTAKDMKACADIICS